MKRPSQNWPPSSRSEKADQVASDTRLVIPAAVAWVAAWSGTSDSLKLKCGLLIFSVVVLVLAAHRDRLAGQVGFNGTRSKDNPASDAATTRTRFSPDREQNRLVKRGTCKLAADKITSGLREGEACGQLRTTLIVAALVSLTTLGIGWGNWFALNSSLPARWAAQSMQVNAEVMITADTTWFTQHGGFGRTSVQLLAIETPLGRWRGNLRAQLIHREALAPPGSTLSLTGEFSAAKPGQEAVGSIRMTGEGETIAEPALGWVWANRFRNGLHEAMQASGQPSAGLVPSLVVGDTSGLDEQLVEDFRATGLSHLTAVSGMNLTLVLLFVSAALRALGVRGWWLRVIAIGVVLGFVGLCRSEPSILRAAAMGIVALGTAGAGPGRYRITRHLALTVIILLMAQPWLARNWGFALSVFACAGITWWAPGWSDRLSRWLPRGLAEAGAVPLAAQIATQPLVTALSGQISLVGVFANLAAAPFVAPVTVAGLSTGVAQLVHPGAAGVLAWLATISAQPIIFCAQLLAGAPAAQLTWPAGPGGILVLLLGCAWLAGWLVPALLVRRSACLVAALALLVVIWVAPPPPGWPSDWRIIACDVGQGSALLIRAGPNSAILVDTGPDPVALKRCLALGGVSDLPMVALTHGHDDHVTGVSVLDHSQVGMVLAGTADSLNDLARIAPELVAKAHLATDQESWVVDDIIWQTIQVNQGPGVESAAEDSAENDASLAALVTLPSMRILVTGDPESEGQTRLDQALNQLGYPQVDVFVVPHHGSGRRSPELIAHLHAPVALISVGAENDYGHPAQATLDDLAASGAQIFRTDRDGSIAIVESGLQVITQR